MTCKIISADGVRADHEARRIVAVNAAGNSATTAQDAQGEDARAEYQLVQVFGDATADIIREYSTMQLERREDDEEVG
ncbi:hypothetical protein K449DRAFT_389127 [Hypoxylon sp. EC38]|nr:hypothetical protein K449DRAFT_389127 [Hypoxylon sp. EC38]